MRRRLLVGVALACVLVIALTRKPHVYEFAHFWLNAKYFPELRYTGLYGALAASLEERNGADWLCRRAPLVRDLSGGSLCPLPVALAKHRAQGGRWSPARWRAFGEDVATLQAAMEHYAPSREEQLWREAFVDHGTNFPPTWMAAVHLATRHVPLTPATLILFAGIDAVFLLLAVAAAAAVGGLAGAVVALVFLATATSMMAYATWSLCRLDWLAAMGAALVLLRRGRWSAAGALWGLSSALKIFTGPLAFLFMTAWYAGRRGAPGARPALWRFAAGWAAAFAGAAALATAALSAAAGMAPGEIWSSYFRRLSLYTGEERMLNRIGVQALAEALAPRIGGPVLLAGIALAAVLALVLLRNLARVGRPVERTAALSLLFAPLLFSLGHYYYLMMALVLAVAGRELRWLAVALIAINVGVIAAQAAGYPPWGILEAESVAYSLALAGAGPILAARSATRD